MKKFKSRFFRATIVGALLALAPVMPAVAQQQTARSFIAAGGSGSSQGWNGFMAINAPVQAPTTNVFGGTNVWSRGFYVTNILTAITNPANSLVITGYVSAAFPYWVTNTSGISDVGLWGNRDGSAAIASIMVDINGGGLFATNGPNGTFTNVVRFDFAAEGPPVMGVPNTASTAPFMGGSAVATASQNLFTFYATGNGSNDVVIITNLPQSFLQGATSLRMLDAICTTNGNATASNGTNGQIVGVWLLGYQSASPQ